MLLLYIVLGYFALHSLVTFVTYAADKRQAKKGGWRVPEVVLLFMSLLGGGLGGLLGMIIMHHKTRAEHWYFWLCNVLGVAVQVAAIVLLLIYKPF